VVLSTSGASSFFVAAGGANNRDQVRQFVATDIFGQHRRVDQIRLESDDLDAAGRMGGGLQREKTPMRADIHEEIAGPQHALEQIAGRRLVAGIGLVDDQMLGADIAGKTGEEMQMKARRPIGTLERGRQDGPAIDRLQADGLVGIHRCFRPARPKRIGASGLYPRRTLINGNQFGPWR
jgi:hypothetical protein